MVNERQVYVDVETASLDIEKPLIIQIAAIAVDASYRQLEDFEVKIRFDRGAASSEALSKNRHDAMLWSRAAMDPLEAALQFR